jgi:hypothetical protein
MGPPTLRAQPRASIAEDFFIRYTGGCSWVSRIVRESSLTSQNAEAWRRLLLAGKPTPALRYCSRMTLAGGSELLAICGAAGAQCWFALSRDADSVASRSMESIHRRPQMAYSAFNLE